MLTQFGPVAAVHVEHMVAFVDLADEGVEDESVWAQLLFDHAVLAFVELVALHRVLVGTVLGGTLKLGSYKDTCN